MDSRRSFLKKASLLAGSTALYSAVPPSVAKAMAISPDPGTTYLNAEHVVFLMQENRSFDHCFGKLRGVRGFNDPRAIDTPNGMPVWCQRNASGANALPFHLDIKNTKATWMGSLPHGWEDMVAARNFGKMDKWLEAKKSGNPDYASMPLTMGYYDRTDLPFYYAFADAFTVCDQGFCSTLTGTSPNRNYFWAGTIREDAHNPDSKAHTDNGMIDFKNVSWTSYPERLEKAGISWGVYQNELSIPTGMEGDEEYWLANFTDNDLEFIKQYQVRFHPEHREWMQQELKKLQEKQNSANLEDTDAKALQQKIMQLEQDLETYSEANFDKLSDHQKAIHQKAFITNRSSPHYRELETLDFEGKQVRVPKGDVFHQFREDVNNGTLPTVSWLVAPCAYSDHPGSPWYGAWYVSEALDILTKDPELWKKTIFIVTYDENDGYFDHVPPFVAPHPEDKSTGATTGIPTAEEFVNGSDNLGLGFRVPMVVASPWTRGGFVNSEVFDHTSSLQFLEHFIEKKSGKKVIEENIGAWRRAVCGNLTSVFRAANDTPPSHELFVNRNEYIEQIYDAKDKKLPSDYKMLTAEQVRQLRDKSALEKALTQQERGTKPACAIPYNLSMNLLTGKNPGEVELQMSCASGLSKTKKIAAPFQVYDLHALHRDSKNACSNFTVTEGTQLKHSIVLNTGDYQLKAYGPNGFYRAFRGKTEELNGLTVLVRPVPNSQELKVSIAHEVKEKLKVSITDNAYKRKTVQISLKSGKNVLFLDAGSSSGWYDYKFTVAGYPDFEHQFAGHLENGKISITDPLMGKSI